MRFAVLITAPGALLVGCQSPCGTIRHTASPHTLSLSWAGEGDVVTYTAAGRTQAVSGEGTALLTGLPPLTEVVYRLWSADGDRICEDTTTTWNLPAELPHLTITENARSETTPDQVLLGTLLGEQPTLFAIDREGRWLWHRVVDEGSVAVDVHIQDRSILYNVFAEEFTEDAGAIRWSDLTGELQGSLSTPGAHHAFAPLPDGRLAYPAVDIRDWYDEKRDETITIVGDRLMEVSPDGEIRELFTIWDHEEPERNDQWHAGFYDQGFDWTHANAVHHSPQRGSYLMSLGHVDAIYELDQHTGEPLQRIDSDWVARGDTVFAFQHDPHWTDAGTLMMMSYTDDASPVAIEYTVNAQQERLVEVWSATTEQHGLTMLGQARQLPGGNILVNYGGKGIIREITPSGEVIWELSSPLGSWFGNVRVADALF